MPHDHGGEPQGEHLINVFAIAQDDAMGRQLVKPGQISFKPPGSQ